MTGFEISKRYLEFFAQNGHLVIPSAPLVPASDTSVLFTTAGMQPLMSYYLGRETPPAPQLASLQKCLRTVDIDQVGFKPRYHTFFEMLGNFAPTGDYFKAEAIAMAWEFVTQHLDLPRSRLWVSVHPDDDQAAELWHRTSGLTSQRLVALEDNWWAAGEVGPCGPDSELYFDYGAEVGCGRPTCAPGCDCPRFLEFWNLVFMQYDRKPDGSMVELKRPGIDTGMGLERVSSILQGVRSNFETDLFRPLIEFLLGHTASSGDEPSSVSLRLVTDHVRACTFVAAEGVLPSNEGRGYVLRRLYRRALLHARRLQLSVPLEALADVVITSMVERYPEMAARRERVIQVLADEGDRFDKVLRSGLDAFEAVAQRNPDQLPGAEVFKLHDTFGFPMQLTAELAREKGLEIDLEGFTKALEEQRARGRRSWKGRHQPSLGVGATRFIGYQHLDGRAEVVAIVVDGSSAQAAEEGAMAEIYLDQTPFYAESGGQVGDRGWIVTASGRFEVQDCQKTPEGSYAHLGTVKLGRLLVGEAADAVVDRVHRRMVCRHHSATHLLHRALREVLGPGAVQAGSWVGPLRTTFDFRHPRALSADELARITGLVRDHVEADLGFHERIMPYKQAVASGAMHLFEEKYGDQVRVVCFGDWSC